MRGDTRICAWRDDDGAAPGGPLPSVLRTLMTTHSLQRLAQVCPARGTHAAAERFWLWRKRVCDGDGPPDALRGPNGRPDGRVCGAGGCSGGRPCGRGVRARPRPTWAATLMCGSRLPAAERRRSTTPSTPPPAWSPPSARCSPGQNPRFPHMARQCDGRRLAYR